MKIKVDENEFDLICAALKFSSERFDHMMIEYLRNGKSRTAGIFSGVSSRMRALLNKLKRMK